MSNAVVHDDRASANLPPYTPLQRRIELAGITAFFGLTVWAVARMWAAAQSPLLDHVGWLVAASFIAALLFADFISGFVHWAADNWGDPKWPILGTGFIAPFRHHHVDPEAMTKHGFVELNGNNCIISLPTFWWGAMTDWESTPAWSFFVCGFWVFTAYWVLGTNQFHAWAHVPKPSPVISFLQRARLILSKPHHDVHHKPPHARNYCITTGWMNPVLRALRFFEILEWGMTKVSGIRPQHDLIALGAPSRSGE